jgi:hypothetical protein
LESLAQGKCSEKLKAFIKQILESMGESITTTPDEQPKTTVGSVERSMTATVQPASATAAVATVNEQAVPVEKR